MAIYIVGDDQRASIQGSSRDGCRTQSELGDYEVGAGDNSEKEIDRQIHMLRGSITTLKQSLDAADSDSQFCDEARM